MAFQQEIGDVCVVFLKEKNENSGGYIVARISVLSRKGKTVEEKNKEEGRKEVL